MSTKNALLTAASLAGLSTLARRATASQLRILCYHGLWLTPGEAFGNCLFMAPHQFEARMARLKRSGQPVLPLGEAVARLEADDLPPAAVVITIDDGWASTHSHMLPILERYELPATLYATTWYSGRDLPVINVAVDYLISAAPRNGIDRATAVRMIEALDEQERLESLRELGRVLGVGEEWLELRQFHLMGPEELADAHRRGLDIQLHTHRHIDVATQLGRLTGEIEENRGFLAHATGAPPATHFCYPGGGYHRHAPGVLAEAGVESATLVTEGINPPGTNPYALRRFLDGRTISNAQFDAYLSGTLHYLDRARTVVRDIEIEAPRRAASALGMLICAV
jgi:peptidoglycan/xylan/chitin deacetylase (PgdA/CDA1 family)